MTLTGGIGKLDSVFTRDFSGPEHFVETLQSAVQVARDAAGIVVGGEFVFLTIERELAVLDAVSETPHRRAEIRRVGQPAFQTIITVGQIRGFPGFVGGFHRDQDRSVFGDLGPQSAWVGERENPHFSAVGHRSIMLLFDFSSGGHCGD
jgi:hypothetical protein